MSTHTPGPWTIEKYTGHPHIEIWTNNNRPQRIAYMQDHLPEVEADAQLIAAAPELLEALYKIDANAAESAEWIRRVTRAAIAKAEGREGEWSQ